MKSGNEQCVILGIDIGTTNISAVLLDVEQNKVLVTNTVANDSKLHTESDISEYDAQWIINQAKKIIDSCINSYPNIKSIVIPQSMISIGADAFYDCSSLMGVIIPDGVVSVGDYAFYGCSSLTSVTVGKSVTYLGGSSFSNCSNLKDVYVRNI